MELEKTLPCLGSIGHFPKHTHSYAVFSCYLCLRRFVLPLMLQLADPSDFSSSGRKFRPGQICFNQIYQIFFGEALNLRDVVPTNSTNSALLDFWLEISLGLAAQRLMPITVWDMWAKREAASCHALVLWELGLGQHTWTSRDKASCELPTPQTDLKHCLQDGHSGMTSAKQIIQPSLVGTLWEQAGAFSTLSLNHPELRTRDLGGMASPWSPQHATETSWHRLPCIILSPGHAPVGTSGGQTVVWLPAEPLATQLKWWNRRLFGLWHQMVWTQDH